MAAEMDAPGVSVREIAAAPAPASQVTLPALPEITRWVAQTRAQRAALQTRADRVREKFEPLKRELAGIERSIKVLDHFMGQFTVDGGDGTQAAPRRAAKSRGARPLLLSGQWSRQYAACRACGTTEKRHKAQGYCGACYDAHRYDEVEG